ncbi:hypothetical protein [Halomonas maura]|uniref:hypothetical protein n=1 Tax=Halomonas maura TaxID=117606 RepID=UPI0025B5D6AB|nr:hypothetical protein [Halomonas maura]MDN3555251.1 hypothetical protein [Halomonas maura]
MLVPSLQKKSVRGVQRPGGNPDDHLMVIDRADDCSGGAYHGGVLDPQALAARGVDADPGEIADGGAATDIGTGIDDAAGAQHGAGIDDGIGHPAVGGSR